MGEVMSKSWRHDCSKLGRGLTLGSGTACMHCKLTPEESSRKELEVLALREALEAAEECVYLSKVGRPSGEQACLDKIRQAITNSEASAKRIKAGIEADVLNKELAGKVERFKFVGRVVHGQLMFAVPKGDVESRNVHIDTKGV
jgi:hypothetical protein